MTPVLGGAGRPGGPEVEAGSVKQQEDAGGLGTMAGGMGQGLRSDWSRTGWRVFTGETGKGAHPGRAGEVGRALWLREGGDRWWGRPGPH